MLMEQTAAQAAAAAVASPSFSHIYLSKTSQFFIFVTNSTLIHPHARFFFNKNEHKYFAFLRLKAMNYPRWLHQKLPKKRCEKVLLQVPPSAQSAPLEAKLR